MWRDLTRRQTQIVAAHKMQGARCMQDARRVETSKVNCEPALLTRRDLDEALAGLVLGMADKGGRCSRRRWTSVVIPNAYH